MRSGLISAMAVCVIMLTACGGGTNENAPPVVAAPSALSYSGPQTYTVGTAIAPLSPSVTGTVTSYGVAPALPAGLALNTVTGQITGTPTAAAQPSSYTISASNSSGAATFSLVVSVNLLPPSALSYAVPPTFYAVGTPIQTLNPSVTGIVTSYSVSPTLPNGLTVNPVSGQVTGVPTAVTAAAVYTITASNSSGAASYPLSIAVRLSPPAVTVSYNVKQVILNWSAVSGATHYQLFKNPNGASGYSQQGPDLTATSYAETVVVHLADWLNLSYIVAACNNVGCTNSAAINAFDARQATGYFKASNTDAEDSFGNAIALSADGTTMAVGAPGESSGAAGIDGNQASNSKLWAGAVYVFVRSGSTWVQQAYLKASNPDYNDRFGADVALSADGSTLAVGATGEDTPAKVPGDTPGSILETGPGAVYVFTRSGSVWSQQAYVKASNPDLYDRFGISVSLSADGDTLAIGAHEERSNASGINGIQADNSMPSSGAAYVFTRSSGIWSQQAYVKASNTDAEDRFGSAVALSADGNILAVGAQGEDSSATGVNGTQADNSMPRAGAVYVFTRSGGTWSQQAYVKASNPEGGDEFGSAVALSANGDTLAVGAYGESSNATGINGAQADNSEFRAGAVYVFTRGVSAWSQQAYVKSSNPNAEDRFGRSVALSADGATLVAGADREDSSSTGINGTQVDNSRNEAGAAYVFIRSGGAWSQRAYVKASNTDVVDSFGNPVALSGDGSTLAIGAPGERSSATGINGNQMSNSLETAGAVYVY